MASTFINLPVTASAISGPIDVNISASNDSIKISDGTDTLAINSDGSINVALTGGGLTSATYNEVTGVASGVLTTVASFTAVASTKVRRIMAAGTNIAAYEVVVDGNVRAKSYTNFGGPLDVVFDFEDGLSLSIGNQVLVRVLHQRPDVGNFNASIVTQV